jgi:IS605 OrfB family transposase
LQYTHGGHGRKKKLAHLDKLDLHEREFAKTYNHMVSRRVVDYAVKHNAKYIKLEDLSGYSADDRSNFCLRNWSYYELQTMIEYKAQKEGIEVIYVNPAYTTLDCCVCGQRGELRTRSEFICSNPDCDCKKMYKKDYIHSDFNAARNIAMSTDIR